ncbi:MAG: hypothetical protein JST21_05290 [Bacteroidetes bacterium]|jgi:hypothetical protein|nr:hypothetical protein [Bacteroidota bacterium]
MSYKYCTEAEFLNLKKRLNLLKRNILAKFQSMQELKREEDNDYLNLIFKIKDPKPFVGTFSIIYKDVPEQTLFHIGVLKYYDLNDKRHFKGSSIGNDTGLDFIEKNYEAIVDKAMSLYESWEKEDLTEYLEISERKHR